MKLYEKITSNLPETLIPPVPSKFRVGDRVNLNFLDEKEELVIMESRWDSVAGFQHKAGGRWWGEGSLELA